MCPINPACSRHPANLEVVLPPSQFLDSLWALLLFKIFLWVMPVSVIHPREVFFPLSWFAWGAEILSAAFLQAVLCFPQGRTDVISPPVPFFFPLAFCEISRSGRRTVGADSQYADCRTGLLCALPQFVIEALQKRKLMIAITRRHF